MSIKLTCIISRYSVGILESSIEWIVYIRRSDVIQWRVASSSTGIGKGLRIDLPAFSIVAQVLSHLILCPLSIPVWLTVRSSLLLANYHL